MNTVMSPVLVVDVSGSAVSHETWFSHINIDIQFFDRVSGYWCL